MFKIDGIDVKICNPRERGQPAVEFGKNENKKSWARLRIGTPHYDSKSENKTHWMNLSVKAYGAVADRMKNMNLRAGQYIHIFGMLQEDHWPDSEVEGKEHYRPYIYVTGVDYTVSGNKTRDKEDTAEEDAVQIGKTSTEPEFESEVDMQLEAEQQSPAQDTAQADSQKGEFIGFQPLNKNLEAIFGKN